MIHFEGIGKRYQLGETRHDTLWESLGHRLSRSFWPASRKARTVDAPNMVWALKDVSFDVEEGEVVGIIGRNGAGKSTLLKILSRITPPTEGRIRLKGRVASLLEVGTGFHPELTGRENIFMNGAVLGMSRDEMRRKFDEIVAFSEVEAFVDTPVKRYSSGMYVRLAFAVAAHLEPETLVVDEVLAVGDSEFQKKCLGKMDDVASSGRTILFVSHNMAAVTNICSKGIVLDKGRVSYSGAISDAVNRYLTLRKNPSLQTPLAFRSDRRGDGRVRFVAMQIADGEGMESQGNCLSGDTVRIKLDYECQCENLVDPLVAIGINSPSGECYLYLSTELLGIHVGRLKKSGSFVFSVPSLPLASGQYSISAWVSIKGSPADWIQNAGFLTVDDGDFFGSGRVPPRSHSKFLVVHSFEIR